MNTVSQTEPDDNCVICPNCAHQFRAIPVNIQSVMRLVMMLRFVSTMPEIVKVASEQATLAMENNPS